MATDTYSTATDPYRVDEAAVRQEVATLDRVGPFQIVETGRFTRGGQGLYATVEVLTRYTALPVPGQRDYATHTLVLRSEASGLGEHYLITGHYDLSLHDARKDLADR